MHSQTAFLRVRILVGPLRTNISWQKKTKDARGRRLRPFHQNFFGTSSENIDLKKIGGQLLCIIRVYSLLVKNFYSFSKLTILQCLSQSSYSNNCKNPVIHTSEYVGSTKIHRKKKFETPKCSLTISTNVTKKQNEKRSLPTKDMLLWSYYAYSNCKKKIFSPKKFLVSWKITKVMLFWSFLPQNNFFPHLSNVRCAEESGDWWNYSGARRTWILKRGHPRGTPETLGVPGVPSVYVRVKVKIKTHAR